MAACMALAAGPARAEVPDLSYSLAKLLESLDAGLSRGELHAMRIEIGALIRLQVLAGSNRLANLPAFAKQLSATDQAWTVLAGAPACQLEKSALRAPADCRALAEPLFRTLEMKVPDFDIAPNPPQWVQDLLKALQRETEAPLKAVQ